MTAQTKNILMVGVGGQGIILAGDVLALAAMHAGYDAKKSEVHGMSQRGGSVFSHIRFGERVHSPVIAEGRADVLFSLEALETLRWLRYAGPSTTVICADTEITPVGAAEYPSGVAEAIREAAGDVLLVDTATLQEHIQDPRCMNVAFLGVLSEDLQIDDAAWKRAVDDSVPTGSEEANWAAFAAGRSYRRSH
jgi:indolepyruvate ferredoxin oxidoreductase beta subunit